MSRAGFTLMELLVGLTIGTIAVATAAGIFAGVGDQLRALHVHATARAEGALARAWIADALLSADVGPTGERGFVGRPDTISVRSKVWVEEGWTESARVLLVDTGGRLEMRWGDRRLVLLDSVADVSFAYSASDAQAGSWTDRWDSHTGPPRLVRLDVHREHGVAETMLFYLGGR